MTRRVARLLSPPPPPAMYPTDTLRNVRDAAIVQSQRALDMARAAGLETPDAHPVSHAGLRAPAATRREGRPPEADAPTAEAFDALDAELARRDHRS